MEKLSCTQAKQIDLVGYLSLLGHEPSKIRNQDYWYLSPLREEKTPSFKVNQNLNIWYDHGIGEGGNLIDFGLRYFKCSVKELLERLSASNIFTPFSFHPPERKPLLAGEKKESDVGKIVILASRPLNDKSLVDYLEARKIAVPFASAFCHEVDFLLYDKTQKAIGFPNPSGGYELRSADFKGSSSPKDFSLITNDLANRTIHVLEGFTDCLSLLSLQPELETENFLVLNSLSFVNKSLALLKSFDSISLYLDHDTAGRKATEAMLTALPQAIDRSLFYVGYKDMNEYLVDKNLLQQLTHKHKGKSEGSEEKQDAEKSEQTQFKRKNPQYRSRL